MSINATIIESSREDLVEEAERLGFLYEQKAHYCPQAALAAIMNVLHFTDDTLFRSSFGFHGGAGDTNDGTCGALVAGTLAVSYFFGRTRSEFDLKIQNSQATGVVKKLYDLFTEEYGGVRCRDVHRCVFDREFDFWNDDDMKAFLDMGAHEDRCPSVVGKGAGLAVGLIYDEFRRQDRIKRFER